VPKPVSPLVGYNNNVRHKGRIFHVQTEDSGVNRPRIVTHLFADGGRILKSTRTDYSEHVGREDLATVVRGLMKEQHKAMFIALRDGHFDDVIQTLDDPAPVSAPVPRERKQTVRTSQPPPKPASQPPKKRPTAPTIPEMAVPKEVTMTVGAEEDGASAPPPQRRPAPTLQGVSLAELGAPQESKGASPVATAVDQRAPTGHTPRQGTPAVVADSSGNEARYGAPRPAAIFDSRTEQDPGSIFGGNAISEQSLDEVILSYLAEDLDPSADGS
jgi:hypothetical protein